MSFTGLTLTETNVTGMTLPYTKMSPMGSVSPIIMGLLLLLIPLFVHGQETVTCLNCHASNANIPVQAIFNSAHRNISAPNPSASHSSTPNPSVSNSDLSKSKTCIACHGKSAAHQSNPVGTSPTISFGPRWLSDADAVNTSCLNCHQNSQAKLWQGSEHQNADMTCNSCHRLHTQQDLVLNKKTQTDICFSCHSQQRSQARLSSHHPMVEGKTVCSDCHNPHGSSSPVALRQPTLNDNCFSCHAEKRGPFLFEHTPVTEDCSICHSAHGSVNERLLISRSPFLCQQCHSAAFHPGRNFSGADLADSNTNQFVVGKNCLNCHNQIHGSNHPSGARFTR